MLRTITNKRKPLTVIFTEERCHLRITEGKGRHRRLTAPVDIPAAMPQELLENVAAAKQRPDLRVAIPAQINALEIATNLNIEFEDLAAAVNWECASSSGLEADDIRANFVLAEFWQTRGGFNLLETAVLDRTDGVPFLASPLPRTAFENFAAQAAALRGGLRGIASTQALAGAWHLRTAQSNDEALLLILEKSALVVARSGKRINVRNLPFGLAIEQNEETASRLRKRLPDLDARPIHLVLADGEPNDFAQWIQGALQNDRVRASALDDVIDPWFDILETAPVNLADRDFTLTGPEPEKQDPRVAGTVVCLLLVFGTLAVFAFQWFQLEMNKTTLQTAIAEAKELNGKRKSLQTKIKGHKTTIAEQRNICAFLEDDQRLAPEMMTVFELLGRYQLKYTRLRKLAQTGNSVTIEGETVYPRDLSLFVSDFQKRLAAHGLTLFSETVNQRPDDQAMAFKCVVNPRVR